MRRISTGQVGDTVLGTLVTEANTVRPLAGSDTLTLNGNTVAADVNFEITGGNSLRVYNGSNYVDVNAPSIGSNVNFTLPDSTGSSGQVIQTNGSGVLEFVDANLPVSNQTADTSTYYPLLSTSSSGDITGVTTTTGKLEFQPSSGTLTVNAITSTFTGDLTGDVTSTGSSSFSSVDINGGNIDNTVIGSNNAAEGTFTSITETSSIKYKTDINTISNSLDKISKLRPVKYKRYQTNSIEAGLIAEEVEKIIPDVVGYKNGEADSIAYTKLTAYLIDCVKTLKKEIDGLKS